MLSASTAGLIFHVLSVIAFVWLLYLFQRTRAVRAWPSVEGEVIESRIESDADSNSFPLVRYQYTVGTKTYVNNRILPDGQIATTGSYADRTVARYPAGSKVAVFFNPAQPNDSALETKVPASVFLLLLVAVIAFWWIGNKFGSGFA